MFRTFIAAATTLALALPAAARPTTEEEQTFLEDHVGQVIAETYDREFDTTIADMPPALLSNFAEQAGMAPDAFREAMKVQLAQVFAQVSDIEIEMDFEDLDVQGCDDGPGSEGCTPFVLIPQITRMTMGDGAKVRVDGSLLALKPEDRWYFVNIDPNTAVLTETYPFLDGIDFESTQISME